MGGRQKERTVGKNCSSYRSGQFSELCVNISKRQLYVNGRPTFLLR